MFKRTNLDWSDCDFAFETACAPDLARRGGRVGLRPCLMSTGRNRNRRGLHEEAHRYGVHDEGLQSLSLAPSWATVVPAERSRRNIIFGGIEQVGVKEVTAYVARSANGTRVMSDTPGSVRKAFSRRAAGPRTATTRSSPRPVGPARRARMDAVAFLASTFARCAR